MNKYQEALNALCDEDEMYKIAKGYCKNKIQELIDNYAWIPVEERLPENISSYCLVTVKCHDLNMSVVQCARITPDKRWVCRSIVGEIYVTDEVIAWMPLPEAYGDGR